MSRTDVGTASWTDKTLIDSKAFYPPGCNTPEARLRYYSSQFPMVEVDSSYYAMPSRINAQLWTDRTPANFAFNIKAFRLFTGHQTPLKAMPNDILAQMPADGDKKANIYYKDVPRELRSEMWRRYREAIEPMRKAGKLRAVHFQFPPWVPFHPKSLEHIEECQRELEGYRLAIEFRDRSWFEGKHHDMTLAFERERGLINVTVDEPQGSRNSIPAVWDVTVPEHAILRLHGRNQATWNIKGAPSSERFNHDYTDQDLDHLVKSIERMDGLYRQIIFNNNFEDQGQRNARTLQKETWIAMESGFVAHSVSDRIPPCPFLVVSVSRYGPNAISLCIG